MRRADERRPYMSLGLRCDLVIVLVVLAVGSGCCDSRREKAKQGEQGKVPATEVAAAVETGTEGTGAATPATAPAAGESAVAGAARSPEAAALRVELKEVEQRVVAVAGEFHDAETAVRTKHPDLQRAFDEMNASRERYLRALAQVPEYVEARKKLTDTEDAHAKLCDRIARLERGTQP